ncbi:DNA-binding protein [Terrimonas sp.]|uniref:helix-turn-helix domain-containing protein n=1 Tax=Terrimonas sp. TaxID=1914338 RepID=UPI000D521309|nr:helix-turn-helix domain-containing protein [Terrimonas sp.]PVD50809.1 DNA-binding protein [Terrimonas sp.]
MTNVVDASDASDLLTRRAVANMLHISLVTLNKHTRNGLLPAYKIGRRVLYRRGDIVPALDKIARAEAAQYE